MTAAPTPLDIGTCLNNSYEILGVLGQGGFGITYRARTLRTGAEVVIKELAPVGAQRQGQNLALPELGAVARQRLRSQFAQEARLLQTIRVPGLVHGIDNFDANQTCYLVMEKIEGAVTLDKLLKSEGRLPISTVYDLIKQVASVLSELHRRRVLHRDIKPTNLLIDREGRVWLIDLGSAREWAADITIQHTVLFTPGYAPLEQLSEHARRGPGTDIYGLAATAFFALTGQPPAAPGEPVLRIESLRPEVSLKFAHALHQGLALQLDDRPRTVAGFLELFDAAPVTEPLDRVDELDAQLVMLQQLKPGRSECPSCGDVLRSPRPAKLGTCIVCREAKIVTIELVENQCPNCRVGFLRRQNNGSPLTYSPAEPTAELRPASRLNLPFKPKKYVCQGTGEVFVSSKEGIRRESDGETKTWREWRRVSGREAVIWKCDSCNAQFDEFEDGRRGQSVPAPKPGEWSVLYPEEWARVARGLDPGAGNARCEGCAAEYFFEAPHLTLLAAHRDPYNTLGVVQGQLLSLEQARWVAAGKWSGRDGLLCSKCATEFDQSQPPYLRLVYTHHEALGVHISEEHPLYDWHRVARRLPTSDDEDHFEQRLDDALAQSYHSGELGADPIWKSGGSLGGINGTLTVRDDRLEVSTLLKMFSVPVPFDLVAHSETEFSVSNSEGSWEGSVSSPMELGVSLKSGRRTLYLDAYDLEARLASMKKPPASVVPEAKEEV